MKRTIFVATLVASLVFAAIALAGTRHFEGTGVGGNGTFNFDARFKNGKPVRVKGRESPPPMVGKGFAWDNVVIACNGGPHPSSGHFTFPMLVNDKRKFHGLGDNGDGGLVTVYGKFSSTGKRATGTIKFSGHIDNRFGCHKTVDWRVHKV